MALTSNGRIHKMTAAADELSGHRFINHIRWIGATTVGHEFVLTHSNDKILAAGDARATEYDEDIPMYGMSTDGIKVATLDSGDVWIYEV